MAKRNAYDTVHAIALDQHGVFTAAQAKADGVTAQALVMMARRGTLESVDYGLYRDLGAPETRFTPYMVAVLWPRGTTGVLSHDTALHLMELSDVNPDRIHLTVPRKYRPRRRQPPPGVVLHFADLAESEIGSAAGLPITTAARTIRDSVAANLGPALIRQAIADGARKGWLSAAEADAITAELSTASKL